MRCRLAIGISGLATHMIVGIPPALTTTAASARTSASCPFKHLRHHEARIDQLFKHAGRHSTYCSSF